MRYLARWVIFWVLAPVAALAQDLLPAENPPDDFTARQYIDSRGCVFLRDDDRGWQPRVGRDGSAICGYPPTMSIRGIEGRPRLQALDPNADKSSAQLIEEALSLRVIGNLKSGELVSDPRPLETLPDMGPEPSSSAPLDTLKLALATAPKVRQEMSGPLYPSRRLCELLGYDGKPVAAQIGGDPTKGYCGTLPDAQLNQLTFARPVASRDVMTPVEPVADAKITTRAQAPIAADVAKGAKEQGAVKAKEQGAAKKPIPSAATKPAPAAKASLPPTQSPAATNTQQRYAMIPAGARYIQIGSYDQSEAAEKAARRAIGMGYPVVRGKERNDAKQQVVMVGPFETREAIVRALNALNKSGFANVSAR